MFQFFSHANKKISYNINMNSLSLLFQKLTVLILSGVFALSSPIFAHDTAVLPLATTPWRTNGTATVLQQKDVFHVTTKPLSPWGAGLIFTLAPTSTWSRAAALRLFVSNNLARTQVFQARFVHPNDDRDVKAATRNLNLPPFTAAHLDLPFAPRGWRLSRPLSFIGMRGTPDTGEFDAPLELHAHLLNDGYAGAFTLLGAELTGSPNAQTIPAEKFFPFVDAFGQFKHTDWPEKIHTQADFAARREEESRDLATHPACAIPEADRFGGWAKGPQLQATGHFRTEKLNGRWHLIDPDGHLFFSQGINCVRLDDGVSPYSGRLNYFESIPATNDTVWGSFHQTRRHPAAHLHYSAPSNCPYQSFVFNGANLKLKYGDNWRSEAAARALQRLSSWGFNTLGNWCDLRELFRTEKRLPYVVSFTTGRAPRLAQSRGGYWGRLVDPATDSFRQVIRENLTRLKQNGTLDDPYLIGVFVDNELTWTDADESVVEEYFKVIRHTFDELAPNTLYLGCRLADGDEMGPRRVWQAAARYCHVVSANRYKPYPWIPRAADEIDAPILIGEYHFGTLARGALAPGLVAGGDDNTRAEFFTRFVRAALDDTRIVGCHWFQWYDQPLAGRAIDGENYQCGFLDICDTPYSQLRSAARQLATEIYPRRISK